MVLVTPSEVQFQTQSHPCHVETESIISNTFDLVFPHNPLPCSFFLSCQLPPLPAVPFSSHHRQAFLCICSLSSSFVSPLSLLSRSHSTASPEDPNLLYATFLVHLVLFWSVQPVYGLASSPVPSPCYPLTRGIDYLLFPTTPLRISHLLALKMHSKASLPASLPTRDISCTVLISGDRSTDQEESTSTWKPDKVADNLSPLEKCHHSYQRRNQQFYSQSHFPEGRGGKVKLNILTVFLYMSY